jgi:putative transposase
MITEKARYRLLDMDRLMELLGIDDICSFRIQYAERIRIAIANRILSREKHWTESIAVGSRSFVEKVVESLQYRRRRFAIEENGDGSCSIWEPFAPYSAESFSRTARSREVLKRKKGGPKSNEAPFLRVVC